MNLEEEFLNDVSASIKTHKKVDSKNRINSKKKKGNRNYYKVNDIEILEYIALRERNALFFLKTYIEKVLKDSGIYNVFEDFFNRQTKDNYQTVKKTFSNFL